MPCHYDGNGRELSALMMDQSGERGIRKQPVSTLSVIKASLLWQHGRKKLNPFLAGWERPKIRLHRGTIATPWHITQEHSGLNLQLV
jgi:hypothetical protein